MGLLAGAVLGLAQGGGFAGMLQMGILAGGALAVSGVVAGSVLNPLADRIAGMLPGFGKKQSMDAAAQAPSLQQVAQTHDFSPPAMEPLPQQTQETGQSPSGLSHVAPEVLAATRAEANSSMAAARTGMNPYEKPVSATHLPDEWVSRHAAGKQPTHATSAMRH
jgi:hypothetical protein